MVDAESRNTSNRSSAGRFSSGLEAILRRVTGDWNEKWVPKRSGDWWKDGE